MAKGIFASIVVVLTSLAAANGNAAIRPQANTTIDGCAVLMSIVKSAVVEARRPVEFKTAAGFRQPGEAPLTCRSATAVTTAAFGSALQGMGVTVIWNPQPMDPGDFCYSYKLSECYPEIGRNGGFVSAADANFTYDAWKAVRTSVASFMQTGLTADVATFEQSTLRLSLLAASAVYVESPMVSVSIVPAERYDEF